jgi:hypothetical protein
MRGVHALDREPRGFSYPYDNDIVKKTHVQGGQPTVCGDGLQGRPGWMPLLELFAVMHRLNGAAAFVSRVRRLSDGRARLRGAALRTGEEARSCTGNAGRKGGRKPKPRAPDPDRAPGLQVSHAGFVACADRKSRSGMVRRRSQDKPRGSYVIRPPEPAVAFYN